MTDQMIDYDDLMLEVQADISEIVDEIMQELKMPMMMEAVRLRWTVTPEEIKDAVKKLRPDMYSMITSMVAPT